MSLPAEHSSLDLTLLVFSLGPLLKYHLLRESFPDHPTHKQFPHPTEHPFPDAALFSFIATPAAAAAAKSLQSCPTPCDPMDCGPPGSSVHAIFQALVLEWGVIAFSTATPSIFLFMVFLPHRASLVAQTGKTLPAMQETQVQSLNQEDPLENRMATHSNISAWRIPWTEEPGGLQSVGSQRVRHD